MSAGIRHAFTGLLSALVLSGCKSDGRGDDGVQGGGDEKPQPAVAFDGPAHSIVDESLPTSVAGLTAEFVGWEQFGRSSRAEFLVTNATTSSFTYLGNPPAVMVEVLSRGAWSVARRSRCGTGSKVLTLAPGEVLSLHGLIHPSDFQNWDGVRVGLTLRRTLADGTWGDFVDVWTPPLKAKE